MKYDKQNYANHKCTWLSEPSPSELTHIASTRMESRTYVFFRGCSSLICAARKAKLQIEAHSEFGPRPPSFPSHYFRVGRHTCTGAPD